ncbi:MAG: hypothetical protein KIT18_11350 [Burkholderiales bacterium]|nr:hypothetical protein [Burkholderiales bacterium]
MTYAVINSTLLLAPSIGAGAVRHVWIIAVRLLFFVFSAFSLTVARPLRLGSDDGVLPPLLALVMLFSVTIVGIKHVVPRVVRNAGRNSA